MPPGHPCKGAGLLEEATVPVCLLRPHRSASSSFGACDSDASRGNVDIAVKHRLIESSTRVTAPWKHLCGTRACVVSVVRALSQGLPKVWLDVGRLPLGTVSMVSFGDGSERHCPHWGLVRLSSEQAVLWVFLTPNQYTIESFWEARFA